MEKEKPTLSNGQIVDKQTAEADFERFAAAWHIFSDIDEMTIEDRKSFEDQKSKIIRAIKNGSAKIDDKGDILYDLQYPAGSKTQLKLSRPKTLAYLAMDDYKEQQTSRKAFAFMGEVTGEPMKFLSNLDAVDGRFLLAVGVLFLGS